MNPVEHGLKMADEQLNKAWACFDGSILDFSSFIQSRGGFQALYVEEWIHNKNLA